MKAVTLISLKQGSFFHLKDSEDSPLWVRSVYDRSSKLYEIYSYDNPNKCGYHRGTFRVYVED